MKRGITMRMKNYPGRITKKVARKRWEEGKSFVCVPCKCRAYENTHTLRKTEYGLGEMALMIDPYVACGFYDTFDDFCNSFTYYNCTAESGYYPAFYLPKEELK